MCHYEQKKGVSLDCRCKILVHNISKTYLICVTYHNIDLILIKLHYWHGGRIFQNTVFFFLAQMNLMQDPTPLLAGVFTVV